MSESDDKTMRLKITYHIERLSVKVSEGVEKTAMVKDYLLYREPFSRSVRKR